MSYDIITHGHHVCHSTTYQHPDRVSESFPPISLRRDDPRFRSTGPSRIEMPFVDDFVHVCRIKSYYHARYD
jgi:hypothetical protein